MWVAEVCFLDSLLFIIITQQMSVSSLSLLVFYLSGGWWDGRKRGWLFLCSAPQQHFQGWEEITAWSKWDEGWSLQWRLGKWMQLKPLPRTPSCVSWWQKKIDKTLSCWYHIYQMAEKEANCYCVQLLSDDPKDGKKWSLGVEGMKVGRFKGGFVSCWITFSSTP